MPRYASKRRPYHTLDPRSNHFRLLELKPGQRFNRIDCVLRHADLDKPPRYNALSYVWGTASERRTIFVHGHSVRVTVNLEMALRALRLESVASLLWVDALCINQHDDAEKSLQVRKMSRIFRGAVCVLAWTGEASEDSNEALRLIREFATFLKHNNIRALRTPRTGPAMLRLAQSMVSHDFDFWKQDWRPFWRFLNRPYWSRAWVLQELACRADRREWRPCAVYCGSAHISLQQLLSVYYALVIFISGFVSSDQFDHALMELFLGPVMAQESRGTHMLHLISSLHRDPVPMVDLLATARELDATDERDKLYALLALTPPALRLSSLIRPDYSMTTAQVMADYVMAFVQKTRRLQDVFSNRICHCPAVPSWTPEIHAQHVQMHEGGSRDVNKYLMASGRTNADVQLVHIPFSMGASKHGLIMRAKGLLVGTVHSVVLTWRGDDRARRGTSQAAQTTVPQVGHSHATEAWAERQECIKIWANDLMSFARKVWQRRDSSEAEYHTLWRTLVFDQELEGPRGRIVVPAPRELGTQSRYYFDIEDPPPQYGPHAVPSSVRKGVSASGRFTEQMTKCSYGRDLFTVKLESLPGLPQASMGLGPITVRPGDVVAILYGLKMCLILRRKKLGDQRIDMSLYQVIGLAYIHGVMRAELIGRSGVEETTFDLC